MIDPIKKTLIIIGLVAMVLGVGALVYFFGIPRSNNETTGVGTENSGYKNFFSSKGNEGSPDSGTTNSSVPINTTNETASSETVLQELSRMTRVTAFGVSGGIFFQEMVLKKREGPTTTGALEASKEILSKQIENKKTTPLKPVALEFDTIPALQYVERATGHIYRMSLDTNTENKVSNSTIPSIYEAIFDGVGKTVIYRYLSEDGKTIESFLGTLGAESGEFLTQNISDITVSPDSTRFFYLAPSATGVIGITRSFTDKKKTQVFASEFTEWVPNWATNKKIFLTTKASALANGYVYSLDITSGLLTKILGNIPGLTTLTSNDGNTMLYSASLSSGPKLFAYNIPEKSTIDLNLPGLAEKCVWGKDTITVYCAIPNMIDGSNYPDLWYQGLTSFTDRFVKINTNNGIVTQIYDSNNDQPVDAIKLFLTDTESKLFFINKKDSTLWSLTLE